jgi:hypothetical protein
MNSIKNRLLKLEAINGEHDGGIAELFERFCELEGYALPDKLPSRADVETIIKNAIGTALRPSQHTTKRVTK